MSADFFYIYIKPKEKVAVPMKGVMIVTGAGQIGLAIAAGWVWE